MSGEGFRVGDVVRDPSWRVGTIARVWGDGVFDVTYQDGLTAAYAGSSLTRVSLIAGTAAITPPVPVATLADLQRNADECIRKMRESQDQHAEYLRELSRILGVG